MEINTTKTALWINFDGYTVSIWDDGEVIVDRPKKRSRSTSKILDRVDLRHLAGLISRARGLAK